MIKNIIFDIGNVLVDFRWHAFLMDRGVSKEDADFIGEKAVLNPIWKEMDLGVRPEREVIEDMKKNLPGKEAELELMFKDSAELVRPYPGNREWMSELKEKGLKIYLLSNYPREMFAIHSEQSFDFMDFVDGKIVSAYVKKVKPDRDIYELLLDTYNLKAEECVFLDDREENTKAAEKLGIKTVTVKNREQAKSDLSKILL